MRDVMLGGGARRTMLVGVVMLIAGYIAGSAGTQPELDSARNAEAELDDRAESLESTVADLRSELDGATAAADQHHQMVQRLRADLEQERSDVRAAERELRDAEAEVEALRNPVVDDVPIGAPDDSWQPPPNVLAAAPSEGTCAVTRVVDGDTIHVAREGTADVVRLVQVDAPEIHECYGEQAATWMQRLLSGGRVTLEPTVEAGSGRDRRTHWHPLWGPPPDGLRTSVPRPDVAGWCTVMGVPPRSGNCRGRGHRLQRRR